MTPSQFAHEATYRTGARTPTRNATLQELTGVVARIAPVVENHAYFRLSRRTLEGTRAAIPTWAAMEEIAGGADMLRAALFPRDPDEEPA